MAWTYEGNFDSLNDGDLAGQDSWTDDSTQGFTVGASYAFAGAKGVRVNKASGATTITRTVSGGTSGIMYWALYRVSHLSGGQRWLALDEGSYYAGFYDTPNDGASTFFLKAYNGTAYETHFSGLAENTWHIFASEYDNSGDQYRTDHKVAGGSWDGFSSWTSYGTAITNTTRLQTIVEHSSQDDYWDEISASDPDVSSSFVPRAIIF